MPPLPPLHLHRLEPASTPRSLVILLHGYGADGNDLLDLGNAWRALLPDTVFVAPDAPTACELGFGGYQWWSIADGLDPTRSLPRADAQRALIEALITHERTRYSLPAHNVALTGFSQGAMLALHTGLRLPERVAGIVSFSGILLDPLLMNVAPQLPPVLMVHGAMDNVVPFMFLDVGVAALQKAGVNVSRIVRPMMGHNIDLESLTAAGTFLAQCLQHDKATS